MSFVHEREPSPRHIVAVVNPRNRFPVSRIEQAFRAHMLPEDRLSFRFTSPDNPIHGVIEQDLTTASIAVAVGGDGTVSQVAAAILGREIPLGMVPGGSTNMIAKVSGVPSNPEQAARLILGEHRRERIDVGISGDRLLLHLGGAGLDARIFQRTSSRLKRRLRWLAYGPAALQSLGHAPSEFFISVDNLSLEVRSRLVLVANSAELLHPRFHLIRGADRGDGLFEVIVFTADGATGIARTAAEFVWGGLPESGSIVTMRGRQIRIEANPVTPAEIDGEVIGTTPLEVEVVPSALELIRA